MHNISGDRVANLTNRRLWEILRLSEQRNAAIERVLVAQARAELAARNQHCETRRWHPPR